MEIRRRLCRALCACIWTTTMIVSGTPAMAQSSDIAKQFAPTGTLRVGVLMVSYFAIEDKGELNGPVPDLGRELARRLGVPVQLIKYDGPAPIIDAFRNGNLDATFVGITADRAAVFDFGPIVLDLQTTYLVPAASKIQNIGEVDQPGLRMLVPARSAQDAYLRKTITKATIINVTTADPKQAVDMLTAGQGDVFSHVVPMLVTAQRSLPGSRILPGSYFNVPIAIGYAKDRPPAVAAYARAFAENVKKSGFVPQSLDRAGESVKGVVVAAGN